jgi:hypothetical protein
LTRRANHPIDFSVSASRCHPTNSQNPLRAKSNFLSNLKLIWVVQSDAKKYSASVFRQIRSRTPACHPDEGRIAIVTDVGVECGGRLGVGAVFAPDENALGGRSSRVVLAPRCWRQVLEKLTLLRDDGGKKARSPGRARSKPLKPLRRGCRNASAHLYARVRQMRNFWHTRPRVQRAPDIPCALIFSGGQWFGQHPGASRRGIAICCLRIE